MKTNWEEVIKISQEQGLISSEEANDLKKLAGLGQIPNKIWRKALKGLTTFGRGLKQHAPAVLAGAIILPYATQMARAVSRPIMNIVAYNRMKEQLERIAPDIVKKYDEKHLKTVYGLVTHFAPVIAENPVTAAVAVRDNITIPSQIDLAVIKTMTDIQRYARPSSAKDSSIDVMQKMQMGYKMVNDPTVVIETGSVEE